MTGAPVPTPIFDTYWRFAARRQEVYLRRLRGEPAPWTDDPILARHRFTNAYRAADRVSQVLIAEVQRGAEASREPREVLFRTILFKLFNDADVWRCLVAAAGTPTLAAFDPERLARTLDARRAAGGRLYNPAYVMPQPNLGAAGKHRNHLRLLARMREARLFERIHQARDLEAAYGLLLEQPGLGRFLAFQYAIDCNYADQMSFGEETFVVAGPGALDGLSKCFSSLGGLSPEDAIRWTAERQDVEFARLGVAWPGLFGRPLQPIDCQNLFCEISKYARVAHPEVAGVSGRTRIKQAYRPAGAGALPPPVFPARWGLKPETS